MVGPCAWRVVGFLSGVLAMVVVRSAGVTAQGHSPQDGQATPGPLLKPAPLPNGARQLKPMFVSERLFTPDKWWKYEGYDDDRPPAHGVEQTGTVTIGGRLQQNHGAHVYYHATEYRTAELAHEAMRSRTPKAANSKAVRATVTPLKRGDEGVTFRQAMLDKDGKPGYSATAVVVRYGRYIVDIAGASDMKAFGPRPATGDRRWLYESVMQQVVTAALAKWDRYMALLAEPVHR